jgi:hypothetical protein
LRTSKGKEFMAKAIRSLSQKILVVGFVLRPN